MLPTGVQYFYVRLRAHKIQRQYEQLELADAFARIYESGAWGGGEAPCSGRGSRGWYVGEWCLLMERELRRRGVSSVADLGCGDFTVGAAIARMGYAVTGVDVVQSIIDRNVRAYASDRVFFARADLTSDPLPRADAAIVRQVLQHLSNWEVGRALANVLRTYPLVFITEHVYVGPGCVPNVEMSHGPGTRVPMRSGIFVDRPPFNVPAKSVGDIYVAPREALRTWVVENHSPLSRGPANDGGRTRHSQALQP